jgi:hypothetical protein
MKTENERKVEFLIGLARLSRETGIAIGGCGCCGSPSLDALDPEELDERAGYGYGHAGEVSWISPSDSYNWKSFAASVVRVA